MAVVTIEIGKRNYTLSCADGEEANIQELAQEVDKRVNEIATAVGSNTNDGVIMAMAALMMQDEINELKEGGATTSEGGGAAQPSDNDNAVSDAIEAISEYVENIAERIEKN
jgi:cell division protein ZapA